MRSSSVGGTIAVSGKCGTWKRFEGDWYNRPDEEYFVSVARDLQGVKFLEILHLNYGEIDHVAMSHIAPSLERFECLLELHLRGNRLDALACIHLASALLTMKLLISLDLSRNRLDGAAMNLLAPSFSVLTCLECLDVSGNFLDACATKSLALSLNSLVSLKHLDLSFTSMDSAGIAALASTLCMAKGLLTLKLSGVVLDVTGMQTLAPALCELKSLQTLDLRSTGLGASLIEVVAPWLKTMSSLRSLDLSRNKLNAAAVHHLVPALHALTSLEMLDLRDNSGLTDTADPCDASRFRKTYFQQRLDVSVMIDLLAVSDSLRDLKHLLADCPYTVDTFRVISNTAWCWHPRLLDSSVELEICPLQCCTSVEIEEEDNYNGSLGDDDSPRHDHDCWLLDFLIAYPNVATLSSMCDHHECLFHPIAGRVDLGAARQFGGCRSDFLGNASWLHAADLTALENWRSIDHGFLKGCRSLVTLSL